jgi:hypothetical protein
MSYLGRIEDAIREGNHATVIIDGEDKTSPIRDGSNTVEAGGLSFDHGTAEFQNVRDHGRPVAAQGIKPTRRLYGQPNPTKYK